LYRIYNNAGWCAQERLRKQIVAMRDQAPSPAAGNGHRYSYIPPVEVPFLDIERQPAPVPPQTVPQPAPQEEQQTMYTLEQVRQLLAMERAKYV
jgi:hypothetical protein